MSTSSTPKKVGRPKDEALQARRREEILDAAARLFAERGYASADTQVIADSLKIAKGTLYRYFSSKEELFLATVDRVMVRLREIIDGRIAPYEDPLQQVAEAIRAYLAFFAEHPAYVELLIQERAQFRDRKKPTYFQHRDANVGRWRDRFRALIAAGRVREVPVERITDVLSDLVYGTMFTNYFTGRHSSPEAQSAAILDIVCQGILTDGERSRSTVAPFPEAETNSPAPVEKWGSK